MALICPRCQRTNFPDAKVCYSCAATLDVQRGAQPAGWALPAQDSFQRGTASFGQDWAAAHAPAQDRADAFLAQHAPEDARKTDTRHLLLHPLTSSPAGLLAMILLGGIALSALWPAPKPGKRAASASQAAPQTTHQATGAAALEERDIFTETPEERRLRRWRESKKRLRPARASDAFRSSSR